MINLNVKKEGYIGAFGRRKEIKNDVFILYFFKKITKTYIFIVPIITIQIIYLKDITSYAIVI